MIVGLAGVAKSGKDSFYSIANQYFSRIGIKTKRFALADQLKDDLSEFILEKIGVDVYDMSPAQKELIRPLMVAYGSTKRQQTNGKYWTSILQNKINGFKNDHVIFVTDIRYSYYPEDELHWLKINNNGKLIHISRIDETGIFIPPANEEEKINDPILKSQSDLSICWKTTDDSQQRYEFVEPMLVKIKECYENKTNTTRL